MRQVAFVIACLILAVLAGLPAASAGTSSLYSWESGLEGWQSGAGVTLSADGVLGVTDGVQSLRLNALTGGFKNNVAWSGNIVTGSAFDALNQVGSQLHAGGATDVKLEFDLAWDNTNVTANGFAQLGIFVNSTSDGFKEYNTSNFIGGNMTTSFPTLAGQSVTDGATISSIGTNMVHVTVPLGPRLIVSTGTFFQVGFKSNGGWTGTTDWAIDNMKVTGSTIPEPSSVMLAGVLGVVGLAVARRVDRNS
jgi:hypothetical protein